MSRAIRRQQQQAGAQKDSAPQPPRSMGIRRPRTSRGARPPAQQQKRRFRLRQPTWMDDITSELRKVTWPTRDETIYLTTVVIVVAVLVGTVLGSIDLFFNWAIDRLLLR